jgi:hypothetical protein
VSKPKARKKLADFSRPVRATAVILAIASMSRWRASRTDLGTAESNLQPLDGLPCLERKHCLTTVSDPTCALMRTDCLGGMHRWLMPHYPPKVAV